MTGKVPQLFPVTRSHGSKSRSQISRVSGTSTQSSVRCDKRATIVRALAEFLCRPLGRLNSATVSSSEGWRRQEMSPSTGRTIIQTRNALEGTVRQHMGYGAYLSVDVPARSIPCAPRIGLAVMPAISARLPIRDHWESFTILAKGSSPLAILGGMCFETNAALFPSCDQRPTMAIDAHRRPKAAAGFGCAGDGCTRKKLQ